MPGSQRPPDIELGAAVKARKLLFRTVPHAEVRYVGDSSSASERRNLPDEVEPGVTYERVEVRWHREVRARLDSG